MTRTQKDIFLDTEGDGWFSRNQIEGQKLQDKRVDDPLLSVLADMKTPPARVLEIGAANGWRLAVLKERWPETTFSGIDPSAQAAADAPPGIDLRRGTADRLPFTDGAFDLVIFGFCLYLCDRADLFRIAAEADRVLEDGGRMAIYDFHPDGPYRNVYAHAPGLYSYKMDHSALFSWNPSYRTVESRIMLHPGCTKDTPDNRVSVSILRKNIAAGWPDNPHGK